jgi:hypothetical protein
VSHSLVGWKNLYREAVGVVPAPVRRLLPKSGPPAARRVPIDALDAELARAEELFATSEDEARTFLAGFELVPPADLPDDPFSPDYHEAMWRLYRSISGRDGYSVANEQSPFDEEEARRRPFPYSTGSPTLVGDQLIARGFVVKALGLQPPARLVEFGAGWGNLTLDFATMGVDVTVVEVEPRFAALVADRGQATGHVNVVVDDMLGFETTEPYDAALFYESFHHCADHLQMLDRLHRIVTPTGTVAFAAEPIMKQAYPWGPRLDGLSLWSTRRYGWLELGFDTGYFFEALQRTGWRSERVRSESISPLTDVVLARPA